MSTVTELLLDTGGINVFNVIRPVQQHKCSNSSWIKRDQLDVTCFIISLFNAQHVSDVSTSILWNLWLICWVISWVVLRWFNVCWCYGVVRLGWCGNVRYLCCCIGLTTIEDINVINTIEWLYSKNCYHLLLLLVFVVTADSNVWIWCLWMWEGIEFRFILKD